jgi:mutator protein MutT
MKTCTLLLLREGDRVLLAMKKRGFGAGRWNGVGGKIEPGESIEQALVRECQEEIEVTPLKYHKIAVHDFKFPSGESDMLVHTYICDKWDGEPVETDEMAPKWFDISEIPYDEMWQDDRYWMPLVFNGKLLESTFTFDSEDNMLSYGVNEVEKLP